MKKILSLCGMLILLLISGPVNASLTTIGTAEYGGSDYNLIWDNDNNGNSVVWLDYSNERVTWEDQMSWAAGLNGAGVLTYNIDPAYTVDWGTNSWRLPTTVDAQYVYGWDGTTTGGYNITSSEMGHLFYTELGNKGYFATDGTDPQPGWGLTNTGDFNNLVALLNIWYWSGTEYAGNPDYAWCFDMNHGHQSISNKSYNYYGLAVRSGQVSAVPVPGAIWLLGSGLVGLAGLHRRRTKNRV